jgi:hypothetical protein
LVQHGGDGEDDEQPDDTEDDRTEDRGDAGRGEEPDDGTGAARSTGGRAGTEDAEAGLGLGHGATVSLRVDMKVKPRINGSSTEAQAAPSATVWGRRSYSSRI